jgi:primase-polymerase (primpol)-like protein
LAAFETGKCDGIGFNLSRTDIAAFDIDKCRDPARGDIAPEAMAIVNRATSSRR